MIWVQKKIITITGTTVTQDKTRWPKPLIFISRNSTHEPIMAKDSIISSATGIANVEIKETIERITEGHGQKRIPALIIAIVKSHFLIGRLERSVCAITRESNVGHSTARRKFTLHRVALVLGEGLAWHVDGL